MSSIINMGYNKDYRDFVNFIIKYINPDFSANFIMKDNFTFSILNSTLFVVSDLRSLIKNIRDNGYNVNEGPQRWRGQVNSMSSFLSSLDLDYRHSLYNHYCRHQSLGNINFNFYKYKLR
jgi:hypothetical protein